MSLGAFDEVAALEAGSGPDEGDEGRCVHGPPAGLGGLDELKTIARAAAREPAPDMGDERPHLAEWRERGW